VETVDLYGRELAGQLGNTCRGLLTADVSHTVTIGVRKDDTLHPQDATTATAYPQTGVGPPGDRSPRPTPASARYQRQKSALG
jgi:hypothetical protein